MRKRSTNKAKWAILWAATFFFLSQVGLNVYLELRYRDLFDCEYEVRLHYLREQILHKPHHPVLLVMGSSRTVMSFRPEMLPPVTAAEGQPVIVFNFSHIAAGPMMNLVELKRLLRDGIRPDWLVLELMTPQMGDWRQSIAINTARLDDLPTLHPHYEPHRLYGFFLRNRLLPVYKYRQFFLHKLAAFLAPNAYIPREHMQIGALGGDFSAHLHPTVDPTKRNEETGKAKAGYLPNLQKLQMCDLSRSAMREILRTCQAHQINLVLLLTPEGPAFRSWYSAAAEETFKAYCRELLDEFPVPLLSARDWLQEEDFIDSHHVILPGAHKFTRRLAQEVLVPLVQGRLGGVRGAWPGDSGGLDR